MRPKRTLTKVELRIDRHNELVPLKLGVAHATAIINIVTAQRAASRARMHVTHLVLSASPPSMHHHSMSAAVAVR
jgi:hypothetical protein